MSAGRASRNEPYSIALKTVLDRERLREQMRKADFLVSDPTTRGSTAMVASPPSDLTEPFLPGLLNDEADIV